MKCSKCDEKTTDAVVVQGGEKYHFCNYCYQEMESAPKNNTHLRDFLTMTKAQWFNRKIKLAKEQRERGESPWSKRN